MADIVRPQAGPQNQQHITLITCTTGILRKRFQLDEHGKLVVSKIMIPYESSSAVLHFSGIREIGRMIGFHSRSGKAMIIRGINPTGEPLFGRRQEAIFPEQPAGQNWVMMDFDNIPLPAGMDPISEEAIRYVINTLPAPFHNVTCYYQFSASAGVIGPDGQALKTGMNAHIFFCLNRNVPGKLLSAYLKQDAFDNGRATIKQHRDGRPYIDFGFDPSVVENPVQPHFIAIPTIGEGVVCLFENRARQGILEGAMEEVILPDIDSRLVEQVKQETDRRIAEWKRANGYKTSTSQIRTPKGIATQTTLRKPGSVLNGADRNFSHGELNAEGDRFVLFLTNENSPGSWRVFKDTPHYAHHYGNDMVFLLDLSPEAYAYVRDVLRWFIDVLLIELQLEGGRLPAFVFATAQHSTIDSPTGSGKTFRLKEYIRASRVLVICVEPTIALCRQVVSDCSSGENPVSAHFYQDVLSYSFPRHGVLVTTSDSLYKYVDAAMAESVSFNLVVDEVHIGLDNFMVSKLKLNQLKTAIMRAEQVRYLTGTITPVQASMLAELAQDRFGHLNDNVFCHYRFASVRENPLQLWAQESFETELLKFLAALQAKKAAGEPLPRFVLIVPTSKMEKFNLHLKEYGLTEDAHVVSRPESDDEEIEAARVSTKPILISSSLFATGLNFVRDTDILWCYFMHYEIDTSTAIQTLNRANRNFDREPCEVRLFVGNTSTDPVTYPVKEALIAEFTEYIDVPITEINGFDLPQTMSIMVYKAKRKAERNTCKALGHLIAEDSFQNYKIVPGMQGSRDKAIHKAAIEVATAAREFYRDEIRGYMAGCCNDTDWGFIQLARLDAESGASHWRKESRLARDFEHERSAIVLKMIGRGTDNVTKLPDLRKLKVLFVEEEPSFVGWDKGMALPVSSIIEGATAGKVLLEKLSEMASGTMDGYGFAATLNQNKQLRKAFIWLCHGDMAIADLQHDFEQLRILSENRRNSNTAQNKNAVLRFRLNLIGPLLEGIGVTFPVVKKQRGGGKGTDYTQPIVPPWDFQGLQARLDDYIAMLKALPAGAMKIHRLPIYEPKERVPYGVDVTTCQGCRLFFRGACCLGKAIAWDEMGIVTSFEYDEIQSKCNDLAKKRIKTVS